MKNFTENNIAVSVVELFKRYHKGAEATRGISLTVERGHCLAILGPNGAGKTSFLRQITTELKPSSGSIEVFGIDAIREPGRAKRFMGIMPQDAGLFETLTVREHLELFARFKGLDRASARRETDLLLGALDLGSESRVRVGTLSGGQRRRILIGLALLGKPPLLLLDEPTTGLDPESRTLIWKLLGQLLLDGTTIIFSTHYLEEADQLADEVAVIADGKIVAIGTLAQLRENYPHKYRLSYLNGDGPGSIPHIEYFKDFAAAQKFVIDTRVAEYQLATASLEDIYFSLIGSRPHAGGRSE